MLVRGVCCSGRGLRLSAVGSGRSLPEWPRVEAGEGTCVQGSCFLSCTSFYTRNHNCRKALRSSLEKVRNSKMEFQLCYLRVFETPNTSQCSEASVSQQGN